MAAGVGASRRLADCYAWLEGVAGFVRVEPDDRRDTLRTSRGVLDGLVGDCACSGPEELRKYASAYLDHLASDVRGPSGSLFAGYHANIVEIRNRLPDYIRSPWPVFLEGERGTGKGHLARAIAALIGRESLVVPLATMPGTLADSELFGHTKGAFTGAEGARDGLIWTAHQSGAVLFLDDVGECSPRVQAKLLTVLEEGKLRRIGSDRTRSIGKPSERSFQILAACQPGAIDQLRPDLRDRLATIRVRIPPLRERGLDILLLADHFRREAANIAKKDPKTISYDAGLILLEHEWPGNVRELRSVIVRADFAVRDRPEIDAAAIEKAILDKPDTPSASGEADEEADREAPGFPTLDEVIDRHYHDALARTGGNVTQAAKLLGRHRSTVHEWLTRKARRDDSRVTDNATV